jgi:hypothetical protein
MPGAYFLPKRCPISFLQGLKAAENISAFIRQFHRIIEKRKTVGMA